MDGKPIVNRTGNVKWVLERGTPALSIGGHIRAMQDIPAFVNSLFVDYEDLLIEVARLERELASQLASGARNDQDK